MAHRTVLLTRASPQTPDRTALSQPMPLPSGQSVLQIHRRQRFVQRLAVLIERIRAAKPEDITDEH